MLFGMFMEFNKILPSNSIVVDRFTVVFCIFKFREEFAPNWHFHLLFLHWNFSIEVTFLLRLCIICSGRELNFLRTFFTPTAIHLYHLSNSRTGDSLFVHFFILLFVYFRFFFTFGLHFLSFQWFNSSQFAIYKLLFSD